jgi:hypothetical protein
VEEADVEVVVAVEEFVEEANAELVVVKVVAT